MAASLHCAAGIVCTFSNDKAIAGSSKSNRGLEIGAAQAMLNGMWYIFDFKYLPLLLAKF